MLDRKFAQALQESRLSFLRQIWTLTLMARVDHTILMIRAEILASRSIIWVMQFVTSTIQVVEK